MFGAYIITKNKKYKDVALEALQFLTKNCFNREGSYFDFIGQAGWLLRGQKKTLYDQQPLESAAAVEAYIIASKFFPEQNYLAKSRIAFEWYFGRNRNHTSLYNQANKGIYDGLTIKGVNKNQGAESIICFLMAQAALRNALEVRLTDH